MGLMGKPAKLLGMALRGYLGVSIRYALLYAYL